MRRRARTDANHAIIVDAYRRIGAMVVDLAGVGAGCPDLLVGHRGRWHLVEVKDGAKKLSAQKLTADQTRWHADAVARDAGPVHVVTTVPEALEALGLPPARALHVTMERLREKT